MRTQQPTKCLYHISYGVATFWEIAARSVNNLFLLYIVYLQYLFISRFGFKSGIYLFIAPVPVHCSSITFRKSLSLLMIPITLFKKLSS